MVGRRALDRVLTRPLALFGAGALALSLAGGFLAFRLLGLNPVAEPRPASSPSPDLAIVAATDLDAPPGDGRRGDRLRARARHLLDTGQVRKALGLLSDASRKMPLDAEMAYLYAMALLRSGAQDRALFHLQRATRLNPGSADSRIELARVLRGAGRPVQAERELEAARRINGEAGALAELAALGTLGDGALATSSSEAAVDLGGAGRGGRSEGAFTDQDLARLRERPSTPE